jgi:hypothetical protein
MCGKLGIRIIAASSPQAKGRVERVHGTHQDRLVKKLRLVEIDNYGAANRYLEEHYIAEHNRRYARAAAAEADYHRRRPRVRSNRAYAEEFRSTVLEQVRHRYEEFGPGTCQQSCV